MHGCEQEGWEGLRRGTLEQNRRWCWSSVLPLSLPPEQLYDQPNDGPHVRNSKSGCFGALICPTAAKSTQVLPRSGARHRGCVCTYCTPLRWASSSEMQGLHSSKRAGPAMHQPLMYARAKFTCIKPAWKEDSGGRGRRSGRWDLRCRGACGVTVEPLCLGQEIKALAESGGLGLKGTPSAC